MRQERVFFAQAHPPDRLGLSDFTMQPSLAVRHVHRNAMP
jgi:hypothetical protein